MHFWRLRKKFIISRAGPDRVLVLSRKDNVKKLMKNLGLTKVVNEQPQQKHVSPNNQRKLLDKFRHSSQDLTAVLDHSSEASSQSSLDYKL